MKANQKGFSVVELLIVVVVVSLLGIVGWFVYNGPKNKTDDKRANTTQQAQNTNSTESATQESDYKILAGIKYTVPASWKSAKGPFNDSEVSDGGQYLLSPDYKEAGGGQLFIEAGAYISFQNLSGLGLTQILR